MLFLVEMTVRLPADLPEAEAEEIKAKERAYCQQLQHSGKWVHIWRIAGRYANASVFEVDTPDELHEILSGLPLFPYMELSVVALAHHPSAVERSTNES